MSDRPDAYGQLLLAHSEGSAAHQTPASAGRPRGILPRCQLSFAA
jgi:hypothetical protein